jgi:hypothetical protein
MRGVGSRVREGKVLYGKREGKDGLIRTTIQVLHPGRASAEAAEEADGDRRHDHHDVVSILHHKTLMRHDGDSQTCTAIFCRVVYRIGYGYLGHVGSPRLPMV